MVSGRGEEACDYGRSVTSTEGSWSLRLVTVLEHRRGASLIARVKARTKDGLVAAGSGERAPLGLTPRSTPRRCSRTAVGQVAEVGMPSARSDNMPVLSVFAVGLVADVHADRASKRLTRSSLHPIRGQSLKECSRSRAAQRSRSDGSVWG